MADREILIGGVDTGEGGLNVMRGTSVKDTPEHKTSSTTCFDEVVTEGSEKIGGTLAIDKLGYDSMDDYVALRDKLKSMFNVPTLVTTLETIRIKGETPYVIQKNYMDCILSGNEYEMKPEEKSARSLEFTYSECIEKDPKQI